MTRETYGQFLTRIENGPALKLLDKIESANELAFKAYQRYTWRPDTATGRKDLARYEKRAAEVETACVELRAFLNGQNRPFSADGGFSK